MLWSKRLVSSINFAPFSVEDEIFKTLLNPFISNFIVEVVSITIVLVTTLYLYIIAIEKTNINTTKIDIYILTSFSVFFSLALISWPINTSSFNLTFLNSPKAVRRIASFLFFHTTIPLTVNPASYSTISFTSLFLLSSTLVSTICK